MNLVAVGVNHTTADVELRERLAFSTQQAEAALASLRDMPGVREAALLSTCNRTELYCLVDETVPDFAAWLAHSRHLPVDKLVSALYQHQGEQALEHMMRVAGGLDSLVLGEPQILGQMREAYARAHEAGLLNGELSRLFQEVFSVAKRIRTETGIGANPVSVAYAAVSFARHIFADLKKSRALLIGAGEMIELVARHLNEQQVSEITIANRTQQRAAELAASVGGRGISLEELPVALERADILISCTAAPLPILGKGMVERALKKRRHKPMFMVDIAVPRDIEPGCGNLPQVFLHNLDDLARLIEENLEERRNAIPEALEVVDHEAHRFELWLNGLRTEPALLALRNAMKDACHFELELVKDELDHETYERLRVLLHRLVNWQQQKMK